MNIDNPKTLKGGFTFLLSMIFLVGCAAVQTGGDIAQGRQALFSLNYRAALGYFNAAAQTDPNYMYGDVLNESVYSFLGRAQYLNRQYAQARETLQKDLAQRPNAILSRLYLGLTLARLGDRPNGLKDIEAGTKAIIAFINNIQNNAPQDVALYWDPGHAITNAAAANLKMIAAGNINWPILIGSSESLASSFEQEPDRAAQQRERENQDNMQ